MTDPNWNDQEGMGAIRWAVGASIIAVIFGIFAVVKCSDAAVTPLTLFGDQKPRTEQTSESTPDFVAYESSAAKRMPQIIEVRGVAGCCR